ncbi:MAG TPA: cupin domain-containing protein, partial [Candidatus Limnocylindrales bacterium]|nr:cupin domain-containing protein [Candidatus Limnocylindrales bacterium]
RDFDEWWVVLGGVLEWELTGGTAFKAGQGDIVWVPRGTVHHIRNAGDQLSLRLAVAMPPAVHYYSSCEQCGYDDEGPRQWSA